MNLSVIIPTKNRHRDLLDTVRALTAQTRLPDELIVVDQSTVNDCGPALGSLLEGAGIARSTHVWDWTINGLPMARNVGFSVSTGDIVCYLDDDTTPAPNYLAMVEKGFQEFPGWDGICGKVTENVALSRSRLCARAIFRLGIFNDDRPQMTRSNTPRCLRLLPGAACCFRRKVLERFSFDETLTGYALGEDVEFCMQAGGHFRFGFYPGAVVHHRRSETGRPDPKALRRMARRSASRLWRLHRRYFGDDICYLWLCFGLSIERLLSSHPKRESALFEVARQTLR